VLVGCIGSRCGVIGREVSGWWVGCSLFNSKSGFHVTKKFRKKQNFCSGKKKDLFYSFLDTPAPSLKVREKTGLSCLLEEG
jgi:hypothetical protein